MRSRLGPFGEGIRDLRLACRTLRKQPLFSFTVILVLSLGIGATTAVFSVVDAVVLRPLPFDDSARLVVIRHTAPSLGVIDAGEAAAWHFTYEEESQAFEAIGMYASGGLVTVTGAGDPEAVPGLRVTSGVLQALRLTPVLGRTFTSQDEELGPPVLLLSQGYWETNFGSDPTVLGRVLEVNGVRWEVIGVLPKKLSALGPDPALIMPLRFNRASLSVGNLAYDAVARLRSDFTLQQGAKDLARILPLAWEKFPGPTSIDPQDFSPVLIPLKDDLVQEAAQALWLLLAGVCVLLLIACSNVANLFLVRAHGRASEISVRSALGAGRRRIRWEYLKESIVLVSLGGVGGLMVGHFVFRALRSIGQIHLPQLGEASSNPSALLLVGSVTVAMSVLFGILPGVGAAYAARPGTTLLQRRTGSGSPFGLQEALAAGQVGLVLVLLITAGLLFRSLRSLQSVDMGFEEPDKILALNLTILGSHTRDPEEAAGMHERIVRRLQEVPGVVSVGLARAIPTAGSSMVLPFHSDDPGRGEDGTSVGPRHNWVGAGYFETLRIPLLAGRTFTWSDIRDRLPGAILSESLAVEHWGSPSAALGRRVSARATPERWHEVIGVVADVRDDGPDTDPRGLVYWPQVALAFWEGTSLDNVYTPRAMGYAIRSDRVGTHDFIRDVREAIWDVNSTLAPHRARPLADFVAESGARTRLMFRLLGLSSAVALLVGIVGLYAVVAYTVGSRTRELGLRMALGASPRKVATIAFRQGLVLSSSGIVGGLIVAWGLARLMTGFLFAVQPFDPVTYLILSAGLLAIGLAACSIPAWQAARVEPVEVLRTY